MTLGGDPRDLRDLARGLRRAADEIDDVQRRVALAQGVLWRGPAADRFLAEALAIALGVRQAAIQAAMAAVESQLAQARHTIASGAAQAQDTVTDLERTLIDRAKQALERVGPLPLPGHPDWLLLADRLAA